LRTFITLPAAIYSQKIIVNVELLQPEIIKMSKRLKGEVAMATKQFKWQQRYARFKYNSTVSPHSPVQYDSIGIKELGEQRTGPLFQELCIFSFIQVEATDPMRKLEL
jgi:hypothetical protein